MQQKKISIALAEDHFLVRSGLATTINSFDGCQVVLQAQNGKDLQRQVREGNIPELVILDINMPIMNGYETAKWLAEEFPDIRVLILTMYDSELAMVRLIRLGVRAFLFKGVEPAILNEAITTIMKTGFYFPEALLTNLLQTGGDGMPLNNSIVLTPIELQLLTLVCSDLTYKQIAQEMDGISVKTLDHYREALFTKLNVKSRPGLVVYAMENGIVPKRDK
jgi:two-component system invasion response regulator UvrY